MGCPAETENFVTKETIGQEETAGFVTKEMREKRLCASGGACLRYGAARAEMGAGLPYPSEQPEGEKGGALPPAVWGIGTASLEKNGRPGNIFSSMRLS